MKQNKFFLSLAAGAMLLTGCVDQIMEWQEPDKSITEADIPLQWAEALANYMAIKDYAVQYTPNVKMGLGLGADLYISNPEYKAVADANFQMFTTGNAMKHSSVVKANGDLNFTTIDAFMEQVPEGIEVYGHNFLWHTQQKQQYLKTLISPEVKIEVPGGEKCENVVTNGGFENGTTGWTGLWGKYTYAVESPGRQGGNAIHFTISPECVNMWDAQLFWSLGTFLEPGVTYYYEFYAKSDGLNVQFIGQNASYGGIYKDTFTPGSDWTFCSGEFTYEEGSTPDIERVGVQFGGEPGMQIWFDDFKFGKKIDEVEQDPMVNVVTNGSFDDGTNGWTGLWGKYTYTTSSEGYKGQCLEFTLTSECVNMWDAQLFWPVDLEVGKTYSYSYWAKSDSGLKVQFIGQNASYAGIYKDTYTLSGEWIECTGEFTYGEGDPEAICRVGVQFGAADSEGAKFWIDEFKFGEKVEAAPEDPMINIVTNGSFDDGASGWTGLWGKYTYDTDPAGYQGQCLEFTLSSECVNMWDAQLFWPVDLEVGKTYAYSFWAKSDSGLKVQFLGQNESYAGIYKDTFTLLGDWIECTGEFTYGEGDPEAICRVGVQFGAADSEGAKFWIDEFKFGEKIPSQSSVRKKAVIAPTANITYIYKTPEEKKTLLLDAMESWIRQMAEHLPTVKYWDVINEPITDGSNQWRGVGGNFMDGDSAPVEMDGLTLNWGSDHWYWGYYIGQEYAVKAFEFARRYCGEDARLFVNDYNLEVSPGKLKALIDFVQYIEDNGQRVDGIGTQMHVRASSITREQVDEMFKTLAATGKLVRVTELDVALGTATPTSDQLLTQAEAYKMIIESYKENIPESQQSGITIWGLSDNASEHEYWLSDDAPNIFDANYGRKIAYKYVCDAIAGKDISEEFTGLDWKNLY